MDSLAKLGSNARVERGLTVINAGETIVETIPTVNMAKSIILASCANGYSKQLQGTGSNENQSAVSLTAYARLISNTEVEVKAGQTMGNINNPAQISWEVLTND